MTFKLERKSVGATLTKFHVIDGTGTTVGSINVGNEQAGDLQKCWRGSAPAATATTAGKHARAVNAIADALQKGRLTGRLQSRRFCAVAKMTGSTGIAALIGLGAWLGHEFGMEPLSCGRGATAHEDCVREICGTELLFRVALRSNQVYLAASTMDDAVSEQTLLRTGRGRSLAW